MPQINTIRSSFDTVDSTESKNDFCFSQPVLLDDLILCTQLNPTQGSSQNPFQRLVKRMTRFIVTNKHDEFIKRLSEELNKHHYNYKITDNSTVSIFNSFFYFPRFSKCIKFVHFISDNHLNCR